MNLITKGLDNHLVTNRDQAITETKADFKKTD